MTRRETYVGPVAAEQLSAKLDRVHPMLDSSPYRRLPDGTIALVGTERVSARFPDGVTATYLIDLGGSTPFTLDFD